VVTHLHYSSIQSAVT